MPVKMGGKFLDKGYAPSKETVEGPVADAPAAAEEPQAEQPAPSSGFKLGGKSEASEAAKASVPKWMMRGQKAKDAVDAEKARIEKAKGAIFRFFMKSGDEAQITFVDGALDDNGDLNIPMWKEHFIQHKGSWSNFPCVEDEEPCPICASGERSTLVGGLLVLDHRKWQDKQGKTRQHEMKLFVVKSQVFGILAVKAKKLGAKGLTGSTFTVNRTGDKEPAVGNVFEYEFTHTLDEIAKECGIKQLVIPSYEDIVPRYTAKELVAMGAAKPIQSMGSAFSGASDASGDDL